MGWLLNALYLLAGLGYAPIALWRLLVHNRPISGFWEKFTGRVSVSCPQAFCIWLHAVSVGEINLLVHLLPRLKQIWPEMDFVVSTTTRTGHELAKRHFGIERTCHLPWDFTWSVATAFRRIQPDL